MTQEMKPTTPTKIEPCVVETLLAHDGNTMQERRVDPRFAFFAPVNLRSPQAPRAIMSAFSREISCGGIGLLHSMPLVAGTCYTIDCTRGDVELRHLAEVVWCRPAGDGWFMSGCRFVS